MARENQKLQVGLIICIMVIIVLLGATFMVWRSLNQHMADLKTANDQKNEAQQAQQTLSSHVQLLKYMIGAGDTTLEALEASGLQLNEEMTKLKQQFEADMKTYGEGTPEAERNFSSIVKNLTIAIRNANEQLTNADARVKQVMAELDQKVAELTTRAQTAETARKTAEDRLAQETQNFQTERSKYLAQTQADAEKINLLTEETADLRAAAENQRTKLQGTIDDLSSQLTLLKEELNTIRKVSFEQPHGRIVSVNQTGRFVSISLGSADGLRPQVSFSVFDANVSGVQHADQKARIEVTRVLEEHLSEARILEDSLTNPIVRGDVIYTPTWRPGRKIHFALAGIIDLNDDGLSDLDLVRNIIQMNGGVIDAELLEDGTVQGAMTVTTRFMVLGEPPTERNNPEFTKNYSALLGDAQRYGVEVLKIEEFLNLMGWKPDTETINLGRNASEMLDKSSTFRPRRPPQPMPRGEDGGAF
jgi:hypothetical protein